MLHMIKQALQMPIDQRYDMFKPDGILSKMMPPASAHSVTSVLAKEVTRAFENAREESESDIGACVANTLMTMHAESSEMSACVANN